MSNSDIAPGSGTVSNNSGIELDSDIWLDSGILLESGNMSDIGIVSQMCLTVSCISDNDIMSNN